MQKTTCVFFEPHGYLGGRCKALKNTYCDRGMCKFYKSADKYRWVGGVNHGYVLEKGGG